MSQGPELPGIRAELGPPGGSDKSESHQPPHKAQHAVDSQGTSFLSPDTDLAPGVFTPPTSSTGQSTDSSHPDSQQPTRPKPPPGNPTLQRRHPSLPLLLPPILGFVARHVLRPALCLLRDVAHEVVGFSLGLASAGLLGAVIAGRRRSFLVPRPLVRSRSSRQRKGTRETEQTYREGRLGPSDSTLGSSRTAEERLL